MTLDEIINNIPAYWRGSDMEGPNNRQYRLPEESSADYDPILRPEILKLLQKEL
ncbi:MAG: hypothetical protein ACU826_12430 [Gammaproteobacteria bacterium]